MELALSCFAKFGLEMDEGNFPPWLLTLFILPSSKVGVKERCNVDESTCDDEVDNSELPESRESIKECRFEGNVLLARGFTLSLNPQKRLPKTDWASAGRSCFLDTRVCFRRKLAGNINAMFGSAST